MDTNEDYTAARIAAQDRAWEVAENPIEQQRIDKQVASWRKEIARLQDLVAAASPPLAGAPDLPHTPGGIWTRPLYYTDMLNGKQVCRDDLWAVTTQELTALTERPAPVAQSVSVPEGWKPSSDDYDAWCKLHDMRWNHDRDAFSDAASLYQTATAAPLPQPQADAQQELTINGRQLRDALEAAWPERGYPEQGDTELTLFVRKQDDVSNEGDPMPRGLWFYWSEYPEEGVCQLDADAPEPAGPLFKKTVERSMPSDGGASVLDDADERTKACVAACASIPTYQLFDVGGVPFDLGAQIDFLREKAGLALPHQGEGSIDSERFRELLKRVCSAYGMLDVFEIEVAELVAYVGYWHRARLARTAAPSETAKSRYERFTKGQDLTPFEALQFFCSLSMNGQDWLDVEPFFDALAASSVPAPLEGQAIPTDLSKRLRSVIADLGGRLIISKALVREAADEIDRLNTALEKKGQP